MSALRPLAALLTLSTLLLSGCHIENHKDGDKENVDIGTPFGSMHVKTNDSANTGITPYPGATLFKDKDNSSADVNLSFGDFHLGVKAADYITPDSPDKVLAFYRKDLAHFGDIIQCKADVPVGQPTHTSQGLTCDNKAKTSPDSKGVNINGTLNGHRIGKSSDSNELRTGSPQHQHIVSVEPTSTGTKIGLVDLDLPSQINSHDSKDSE